MTKMRLAAIGFVVVASFSMGCAWAQQTPMPGAKMQHEHAMGQAAGGQTSGRQGVNLTVVAKNPDDAKTIARIRGLGFIGLLVQGGHHQPHHLAMAKGEEMPGHGH